jgi:thiamine-phosphate pyrophosphorylase
VHPRTLRIIDANLNRICEGLRVLEDVARFIIDDSESSRRFKSIRHDLRQAGSRLGIALEKSRDAANDVGADFDLTHQHEDFSSIIRANSRRAEEGLRVIEELSKLPELSGIISGEDLKKHRYAVYTLSRDLILTLPGENNHELHGK